MASLKQIFKSNAHNPVFKVLAGLGRSINRLYENRNHDVFSNGEITILKKIAKLNPTVIVDGGANIGTYAGHVRRYNKTATIYAFEPVKSTAVELIETAKKDGNMDAYSKGLYSKNCQQEINIYTPHTHSSIYDIEGLSNRSVKKVKIDLVKGDDFMKEEKIEHIDFLKIDVEGAEYEVLLGFEKALKEQKIRCIQLEYGYINISTKKLLIDFYNLFESHGYVVGKIFPKTVEFRKYAFKYEDFLGPNIIAVKANDHELISLLKSKSF